jgi:hypothetical protein
LAVAAQSDLIAATHADDGCAVKLFHGAALTQKTKRHTCCKFIAKKCASKIGIRMQAFALIATPDPVLL